MSAHIITVDGWFLTCTCGFHDLAGELSVRNHAAVHDPAPVIREAGR